MGLVATLPDMGENWIRVDRCPLCGSSDQKKSDKLSSHAYFFGGHSIMIPPSLQIIECAKCSLIYKSVVPAPDFVLKLTAMTSDELWQKSYGYEKERELLNNICAENFSILDIGAASGGLLDAVEPDAGRRSALDIVRFKSLQTSEDGEFICGFLDDDSIEWSNNPYDVVTAFDVFEHFYRPNLAMDNLRNLVAAAGIVFIETGDASFISRKGMWYYLALFEHHICWTPQSIGFAAASHGFEVFSIQAKQHKTASPRASFAEKAKHMFYSIQPSLYHKLQALGQFNGSIPPEPGKPDHMAVILKRL